MNRFIMVVGFLIAMVVFSSGCYQSSLHENDPETVLAAGPEVADVAHVDHVMPAQEFEIVADNLRQSTILVAGGDIWHNVAQYRAIASSDTTLQCVRVRIEGDAADISRIAIAQDGLIKGQGILPSGTDTSARICLEDPLDLSEAFQVLVQISQIVSGASVGGEERSVTRTGDRFRIGVESVNLDFEEVEETFSTIWGNEFQIRKTVPSVTRQALSRETLVNGLDQDLFRFQISADNAGMLAIHSIAFELSGDEMTLSNIRMRRGSTDLTPSEYQIVINGTNADSLDIDPADTNRVVVQFLREQTITGSGNVYTLYAATGDLQPGDGLTVAFDPSNTGATGYLHDHSSLDMSAWGSAEDGPVIEAGFIWSDMSEIPHSDASRLMGGSRDWTDGLYVTGQEQLQTLVVL